MELGCINHALLTAEAIQRDGLKLAGWVANQISADIDRYQANLETLQRWIPCPMIAEIPFLSKAKAEEVVEFIKLDSLLG